MDLIYRKEKYQKYLQKLQQIRGIHPEEDDHTLMIKESINDILEDLRDKSDFTENKIAYAQLIIPLILILGYSIYLSGIGLGLIFLIFLMLYISFSSFAMKKAIMENRPFKSNNDSSGNGELEFLSQKVSYVLKAIAIKQKRIEFLQYFYMFFFPPMMYFLFSLIFKIDAFGSPIAGLALSYLLSSPFWYYYFNKEKTQIQDTRQILTNYQAQFLQSIDKVAEETSDLSTS